MSVELTIQPNLVWQDNGDGTGFGLVTGYTGHHAQLQIGNVSIAFDDCNNWQKPAEDGAYSGIVIKLSELSDDPVRFNDDSPTDVNGFAAKLMYSLAADLGYRLEKV